MRTPVLLFLILFTWFSLESCGGEDYHGIELIEEPETNNGIPITENQNNDGNSINNDTINNDTIKIDTINNDTINIDTIKIDTINNEAINKDTINNNNNNKEETTPKPTEHNSDPNYGTPVSSGEKKYLFIEEIASGTIKHQSAACYGNYVFLLADGMKEVQMYNIQKKQGLYTLTQTAIGQASIYHCNQSCFGKEKYDSKDPFPLLYVSVFQSNGRCSAMVYRILANWNNTSNDYDSFSLELVQRIYYPKASDTNALYNANTVIDSQNNCIYTYSRNNNSNADNYMKCRVSKFPLPDPHSGNVAYENNDIIDSFELNVSAANMQGAAFDGNYLYIGRGYPGVGYVYLYIIDLKEKRLKYTVDLFNNGFREEPEGAFFYNGVLYISTNYYRIYQFLINTGHSDAKAISISFDMPE